MGKILASYLYPHPPIIIPEIGRGEESKAKNTIEGVKALSQDIKEKSPNTIIVTTPHGPLFSDAISISMGKTLKGDLGRFGFSDIKFKFHNNIDMVERIVANSNRENIVMAEIDEYFAEDYNVSTELDHGVLVPLYFVDKIYKNFKLIHITYGLLSPIELYRFGMVLQKTIEESKEDAVIIASGDLSHKLSNEESYSYSSHGEEFDEAMVKILEKGDMEKIINFDLELAENAGECGLRSLMIMAGTMDGYKLEPKVYSYEGPYGVGYATAKFELLERDSNAKVIKKIKEKAEEKIKNIRENEDRYTRLARESIEYYLEYGKYLPIPEDLPGELLDEKKAVFVTLKKDGILRGCIGTTQPRRENIALEIIKNAVSAGMEDPRFPRVGRDELNKIIYFVDVLSEPEPISSMEELDIKKYGVIVKKDMLQGLLLPNIEGVDSVEEQVSIALEKAGIGKDEEYSMERFKVVRHR